MSQEYVKNFQNRVSVLECKNKELEQHGRRLCLRIGVQSAENETSDDVLDKVKSLITEFGCEIPDVVIDRVQRIGKGCKGKTRNIPCKGIIVKHRVLFLRTFVFIIRF